MKKLLTYLVDNDIRFVATNNGARVLKSTMEQSKQIQGIIESEKLYLGLNGNITVGDPYKDKPAPVEKTVTKKKK